MSPRRFIAVGQVRELGCLMHCHQPASAQGEQGRGRRHVPELRPPNHRVYNHRCTGSTRAQELSPALRCCSATVTQAIS